MSAQALTVPTLSDIKEARKRIAKYLLKTPLRHSTPLSRITGAEVYIKYENVNPTCVFKVRGGINLIAKMVERIDVGAIH